MYYINLLQNIAIRAIPTFFSAKSNQSSSNRVRYYLNLGLTNRKVDQLEQITITGRSGLNLIQPTTKQHTISSNLLNCIGKLILFILNRNVPCSTIHSIFKRSSKYQKKYLESFARQLHITSEEDIEKFVFPGLSILINNNLNPHYDAMNPSEPELDWTMSLSCMLPVTKLPLHHIERARKEFGNKIPFCIVLYRRRALETLSERMCLLRNFIKENPEQKQGRKKMSELLMKVEGPSDYVFNFFDTSSRENLISKFKLYDNLIFGGKMLAIPEAVDKMVRHLD